MIDYEQGHWAGTTLVWRGTVLSRLRTRILAYAGWAGIVTIAAAGRTIPMPDFGALAHSLVGVAMGMLLVFRTNASYDRYWEGRKRWGGIIASARNLLRVAKAHIGDTGPLAPLVHGYAVSLKQHLRREVDDAELQAILGEEQAAAAARRADPPLYLATLMSRWVARHITSGELPAALGRELEGAITKLVEHQEACERILKTPVPFAYVVQIRQLLAFYLLTLPVVLVPMMEWMVIPVTAMVAFAMLGIEEAGVEIEDPFGTDPNDLPLEHLCDLVRRDASQVAAIPESELLPLRESVG